MVSNDHFVLTAVRTMPGYCLLLTYADGQAFGVSLGNVIRKSKSLAALKDEKLFKKAKLGLAGRSVEWIEDELDMGSDNLRHLAIEQAGGIGHERIWTWLHETGMTLEQGAEALGISRRILLSYRDGKKAIPRIVWLACLGWQAACPKGQRLLGEQKTLQATKLSALRKAISEGLASGPPISADEVFNRLEAKYLAMIEDTT